MIRSAPLFLPLAVALLGVPHAAAAPQKTLEIGTAAPDFELPGIDDKTYRLDDFSKAKLLVVVFTCNHCPTAQAYEDRIVRLDADYRDRGVALVAISPNDPQAVRLDELGYSDLNDSLADMKIRAEQRGFHFPYLYDGDTQKTSAEYGVLATPHVYIFDRERRLRYNGRIDDAEVGEVTSHDARNAIEALLADKPVPLEKTRVFGCSTKWADKRQSAVNAVQKADKELVALEDIGVDAVKSLAVNDGDRWRLVNVWATWCGPCVQEMPELVTINRMYRQRKVELVTISLDDPSAKDAALIVLKDNHVAAKNYLFESSDRDKLAEALDPQWQGPLPYTLLIAPGGKVVYRSQGSFEPLELKRAIVDQIGRTYPLKKRP